MDTYTFKSVVIPLNRKLSAFAYRFLNDQDEAKDIVQDIYLKLWNLRDKLDEYKSVEALAMKMTRNLCLDKIKLKKTIPINTLVQQNLIDENKQNESEHELSLAAGRAKRIIELLDEPQKSVMQLHDIQGYDYDEIAEIMDMNINTIRVMLSRARKKVREILMNKYNNHEKSENEISFREIL
ncbi:MAG: RNA polymerase sigma factor [Bacteroidales bacterium]